MVTNKTPNKEHPPKRQSNYKMDELAAAAGLSVKDFFFRELDKHGSIRAAAIANGMKANSWLHHAHNFGVKSKRRTIVEYTVDDKDIGS